MRRKSELVALKDENLRLCREIAKLKAKNITLRNQIIVLTEEYREYRDKNPPFDYSKSSEKKRKLEKEEQKLIKQIQELKKKNTQQSDRTVAK